MNYQQALDLIHSRKKNSHEPGLDVMRALMHQLGDPQDSLRYLHIAGTNGKGSVTAMTAAILKEAGYKVGMSISPYVVDFRERFQINGEMIPEKKLVQLVERIAPLLEKMELQGVGEVNEFELVTAIAFLWFAEEKCDIVCLEVGLGGRFDATNIIPVPLVSCITRIGLDHTAILGDTVAQIAAEKCGIIKKDTTVVCYPEQPAEAMKVIRETCEVRETELIVPDVEDLKLIASNLLQNHVDYGGYEVELPMKGRWQGLHMAMSVEAILALCRKGFEIEDDAILAGLQKAKQPARMEIISLQPLVLLDGGHNPDGIDALAGMIERSGLPKMHAVLGMMKDKACEDMLRRLSECFDVVYTVTPDNPRAMPAEELAALALRYFDEAYPAASVEEAITAAKRGIGKLKGMCVCGSLYLAGEARKILLSDANG